ncbi:redoxin domain-containing protein [Planctomicrobium sp. SH661]|uniref:TlpA family protein disulfide reductase n=1 Tax=Planctomicrobium sp. SH661 TaxID=3448124 RepID=UPI003F5BCCF8
MRSTASADDSPPTAGQLTLRNGGIIAGEIRDSQAPGVVRWQGEAFTQPFEFAVKDILSIDMSSIPVTLPPQDFLFTLANGDHFSGQLMRWDDRNLHISTPEFGNVQLHADSLRRIDRMQGNTKLIYPSLDRLEAWSARQSNWVFEGGDFRTSVDQAMLSRDLKIPEMAVIELELAWEGKPDFALAMGVRDPNKESPEDLGWRIECWNGRLNLVRECSSIADITPVAGVEPSAQSVRLLAYLNQKAGELSLYHSNGTPAGQLHLPPEKVPSPKKGELEPGGGFRLINRHGNIRLRQLSVAAWDGIVPQSIGDDRPKVCLSDGTEITGTLLHSDPDSATVIVKSGDGEKIVPFEEIVSVQFKPAVDKTAGAVELQLQSGTRVHGDLSGLNAGTIEIVSPQFESPLRPQHSHVRRLTVLNTRKQPTEKSAPLLAEMILPKDPRNRSRSKQKKRSDGDKDSVNETQLKALKARFTQQQNMLGPNHPQVQLLKQQVEAVEKFLKENSNEDEDGLGHRGRLVSGDATPDASCLNWQPEFSLTSSPLKRNASGRIVYRAPAVPDIRIFNEGIINNDQGRNFVSNFLKRTDGPARQPRTSGSQLLHLRTGDVINCQVLSVDEEGVLISSPVSLEQKILHEKIKAVELIAGSKPADLQAAKRERLLTLPRSQKASPPTHLFCSRNGDFLRCRLLELNETEARIEVHLEEMILPADRIAHLIWLHADEMEMPELPEKEKGAAEKPVQQPGDVDANLVRVLRRDEKKTTFTATKVEADAISGTHEILGECQFRLSDIDQIVFGSRVRELGTTGLYEEWKLHPSIEPLVAQDLGEIDGTNSPLIGKAAPEVKLGLLGGGQFKLSDQRGKVVVLDFWATWCGPCMQTLPLLHPLTEEFPADQVEWISINLEEPANHVQSVLDRHKLKLTVALDVDGVVAHRYEASTIPQHVVIDPQGNVTHVFIGGGPVLIEKLREAIPEALSKK